MACRLFGAKPLSEPVFGHCQLDPLEQIGPFGAKLVVLVIVVRDYTELLGLHGDVVAWKHVFVLLTLCDGNPWWRHQMETFSALLAIYVGNSPVTIEFPAHRQVTRNFDVFFDLRLNKRLGK